MIYDYNDIDVVKTYKFEVEYNYYLTNIINNVYIKEIYTMPYINDEENWNINGENTNIRAIGKDAGNPNIILVYSKDKNNDNNSYSLLNAIKDKDIILNSGFERKKFLIDNRLFNHLEGKKIYCYAYLPIVNNVNRQALENSIIINICDLNCLSEESYKSYYIGSNIITLWYYGFEDKKYQFILTRDTDTNFALPLGATVNVSNVLSNIKNDINSQDLVILKASISKLAQETLGTNSLNWNIIKNKSGYEYATDEATEDTFKYFNDLNTSIEYTDDLQNINNGRVNKKSEKYINDFSNIKTTNILYPKYQIVKNTVSGQTTVINEVLQKILQENEVVAINIDNHDNIIISNELRDVAADIFTKTSELQDVDIVYKTLQNTDENYDEYVFNSNVPSLDLKEIFLRNTNNLNRLNIISLDAQGNPYYGYIGTSYDEPNKSTLHIGTLEKNINLGSNSLIDEINRDNFVKHNKVSIDFNNVFINSSNKFSGVKPYVIERNINNIQYKMGKAMIFGQGITQFISSDKLIGLNDNVKAVAIISDIKNIDFANIPLKILGEDNKYAVCLNSICKDIFNIDFDKYSKIKINAGKNKLFVIKYLGLSYKTPKFFMIVNDPLTKEFDNTDVIASTDSIDLVCCTTATSEDTIEDIDTLQIICKYDKYNIETGNDCEVTWNAPELIGIGDISEDEPILTDKYYWWIGLTNPLYDNEANIINNFNSMTMEEIQSINNTDPYDAVNDEYTPGWRLIGDSIENNDHGYVVYLNNNFNITLGANLNDKKTYYLILPLQVYPVDTFNGEQCDIINRTPVEIRGHYYNIFVSRRPELLYQWSLYYDPTRQ